MSAPLKTLLTRPDRLAPGHRMCAGCGAPVAVRAVMRALDPEDKAVVSCATGCLEVSTFTYPFTAWRDSFIHNAFENAAATLSGAEAAYRALSRDGRVEGRYRFVAFGGDGGTYDIGFQSLSGAMERGHPMLYVCYDNGAYMNTGIQRSSATPAYADTTTSPVGSVSEGKPQRRKDMTRVLAAHGIPYAAQSAFTADFRDLHAKAEKSFACGGPAFLNVLAPCPRGWRYEARDLMKVSKLAIDTCFWPLYEIEEGVLRLTYTPKKKLPVTDFLAAQGRFAHLFPNGEPTEAVAVIQEAVDREWEILGSLDGKRLH